MSVLADDTAAARVVRVDRSPDGSARFTPVVLAPAARDDLLLADDALARLDRLTRGVTERAGELRAVGLPLERGLLVHGPTGSGKTHLVRYVVGSMPGRTTFLLSARDTGLLRPVLALVAGEAAATVIVEDVDRWRDDGPGAVDLGALLDATDGFAPDADVLFVLTTSHPELMPTSLTLRPGRVDDAIALGPLDPGRRARLLARALGSCAVEPGAIDETAARLQGANAAFLVEVARRAALLALERAPASRRARPRPPVVSAADLSRAAGELMAAAAPVLSRLAQAERAPGGPESSGPPGTFRGEGLVRG